MIQIKCQFLSNGQTIKKTAILKETLNELSNSKKNEAFDTSMECYEDGYWSLFFEGYPEHPGTIYEVELKFDIVNRQKTLEPLKAITWKDDVISDVQLVTIKTKYL